MNMLFSDRTQVTRQGGTCAVISSLFGVLVYCEVVLPRHPGHHRADQVVTMHLNQRSPFPECVSGPSWRTSLSFNRTDLGAATGVGARRLNAGCDDCRLVFGAFANSVPTKPDCHSRRLALMFG